MTSKLIRCFWIVVLVLLVGCGEQATPTVNDTAMPAALTMAAQTMTAMPTSTVIPTNTPLTLTLTPTFTSAPTSTSLPFVKLDGLRVAYTIAGNLYVQDSGEQPIQLTNSGQDHSPVFSDDGQKLAFYREWESEMNQLYVINVDGSGDQTLVTSKQLSKLGLGYDAFSEPHSITFVPGTHLLLFNTHHFSALYPKTGGSQPRQNYDLILVDTDTGELRQFKTPGQGGYFLVSPNGKWIAVQTLDHVDVINIHGRDVRRNLATYSYADYDCAFYEYICAPMYWLQDSSELIVAQPIPLSEIPTNRGNPLARTIWRYPMNGHSALEIRMDPTPGGEAFSISPDGNWIVYSLYEMGSIDGVYLGNLHNGSSQLIYKPGLNETTGFRDPTPTSYDDWSPDSAYFIFGDVHKKFVGDIHGEITPFDVGEFLGWIDGYRYLYGGGVLGEIGKLEKVRAIQIHNSGTITFVFLKK